jgi:tetratricopeptide (TPR) repeat protein
VSFDADAEYDVVICDPATEAEEEEIGWYFEQHLRYPFLDIDREQHAVRQIAAYGESLFRQVFGGEASHEYRALRERSFNGCRLEVSGPPELHRMHWEAIRDPDLATPLALRLPITRRVAPLPSKFALPESQPTLNILVAVARPAGNRDVGYRTISRPLLDALRTAGLPVNVELVRPGTWEALQAHMRSATERHGSGWYHVVHFDLHGALIEHADLKAEHEQGRLAVPADRLEQFSGKRGFLFFEANRDSVAVPVPADAVASLLAEHRVPIAVLNACQSAKQSASEVGLAHRLAEAGVPVTLGMAYSVTVSAAVRAMPVLYGRLGDGSDPVMAVHAARRELHENRSRRAYFDQQLELEDWLLPVVFGQRPFSMQLRPMDDTEQASFFSREAMVGDEPPTEYGFVGRDLDIQAIERLLLTNQDSNELLVRGMAGAGKSTLLRHLGWWWQRTGLVEETFWFSYEDRAWTSDQIVREIRRKLFTPAEHARADTMPEAAQLEQLAQRLRSHRHLLVLDNAESITAAPAAIPHALSLDEQQKLKTLLSRLRGGRTLVLLGSREAEAWLTSGHRGPGIYPLHGLDPEATSILVERILARHGATSLLENEPERTALQDLITLLGGYPLPLTVVLPVLASSPPTAVLAELQEGRPGADPAGLIHRAIEYSHGKLDPALQSSLLLLAPFTGAIGTGPILEHYRDLLREDEAIQELGPIDLAAALDQAMTIGLATQHSQHMEMVQVQPVLPYFLRNRLRARPDLSAAADRAHYQLHRKLGVTLHHMLTAGSDPQERAAARVATRVNYANLTSALRYAVANGQPIVGLIGALDEYLDQEQQQETRLRLLEDTIAAYPAPAGNAGQRELGQLHDLSGSAAFALHQLAEARAHYEASLGLEQTTGNRHGQAVTYHQLGMIAQQESRLDDAEAAYHEALAIYPEFGDRIRAANSHHQLGTVAQQQGRLGCAEAAYRKALDIYLAAGNQYRAASTHHQLGSVTAAQQRPEEALANYKEALSGFTEFGDHHGTGRIYLEVGTFLLRRRDYPRTEAAYHDALDIFLRVGDQHYIAKTYHQLGNLALAQERYEEARNSYHKALNIFSMLNDRNSAALTQSQLDRLTRSTS